MRWTELDIIRFVLINASMCLTAWFGWSLAADVPLLGILLAAIFAMITRGVGRFFLLAARYEAGGHHVMALQWMVLGVACGIVNILTDYGTSAAIRDASIVSSTNVNNTAKDARHEITRLKKRISEIRATTQWRSTYLSPDAYDAQVLALKNETERGRNIWQRSKECTNTTVASSERVCKAIAAAIAAKANAANRLSLKAELVQLERELVEAKARSNDNQAVSNPAIAQVRSIVAWVGLTKDASQNKIWWGNQGIMLITCILMTAAIIGLSIEQGFREGRHDPEPQRSRPPTRALPDATPLMAEATPEAAAASRRDGMHVYEKTTRVETRKDDAFARMMREAAEALGEPA